MRLHIYLATTMTTSSTDMSSPSDMTTSSQVAQATACKQIIDYSCCMFSDIHTLASFVLSVMATATPRYDCKSCAIII